MEGYNAYAQAQNVTEDPRHTEYRLLAQVTGALIKARDGEGRLQEKIQALLWNQRVWEAFMADLTDAGNILPQALKAQLVSLAIWVVKETNAVLDDSGDIDGLIAVNRNIMDGLRPAVATAAG